jgi:hypothetical protein
MVSVGYHTATYQWTDFRRDVNAALADAYGTGNVHPDNNCVKISGASGCLPADIVPSIQYRRYTNLAIWIEGIWFWSASHSGPVINYPKQHYDNGVAKNGILRTDGRYKPAVRMFKNARTYLVSRGIISEDLAPSYFLESLIYNVPDDRFGASYRATYRAVVEWVRDTLNGSNAIVWLLNPLTCQNGQLSLFGTTAQQWNFGSAQQLVSELINLWNGRY